MLHSAQCAARQGRAATSNDKKDNMKSSMRRLLAAHVWCFMHPACVEKLLELIILAFFRW